MLERNDIIDQISLQARKALHALRGLVKLQALVRGHLVRKQTTATLRRMHALMAIQVRARFQRIQMAEEPRPAVKSRSSRYGRFPQEMGFKRAQRVSLSFHECINISIPQGHQIACLVFFHFPSFSNQPNMNYWCNKVNNLVPSKKSKY